MNHKDIIDMITKMADVPSPSGTRIIGPTQTYSAKTNYHADPSTTAVKEMQNAIQVFASTAINYHIKRDPRINRPTPIQPPTTPQPSQDFRQFNDFITLHYLNSSPLRGNERAVTKGSDTAETKSPVYDDELIQMENVVDNIARIGGRGRERFVDGIWGFRTQNALRNLYAFGDAIIRASEDFDAPDYVKNIFTKDDATTMKGLIPTNYDLKKLSSSDKTSLATRLTIIINKLTRFYLGFVNSVTKNPAYRRFTDDSTPLWTQQPTQTKDAGDTSEYQDLMKNIDELYLPRITIFDVDGTPKVIDQFPLTALIKPDVLVDMITRWGGYQRNEIDKNTKIRFLRYVMQQINSAISYGTYFGGQPLTGYEEQFSTGGPLAPGVTSQQLTPHVVQQQDIERIRQEDAARGIQPGHPWGWATGPDTRTWAEKVFRDRSAPRPPIGNQSK